MAEIAHAGGATLVVDNVFATPMLQSPLALGADCVIYSATKHIDGQGRCLGGVILASRDFIDKHVHNLLRQTGPALSPFNAWVLLKGLETLSVRVAAQTAAAARVADALAEMPGVARVIYPGRADHPATRAGAAPDEGRLDADRLRGRGRQGGGLPLANALRIIGISNNLGDAKSLVTHPATTTHQRLTPGGARRPGHLGRHAAPVGRARGRRRPHRRPGQAADAAAGGAPLAKAAE